MAESSRMVRPKNVQDIMAAIAGFGGDITYIAGGTDLVIAMQPKHPRSKFVDLSQIGELDYVDVGDDLVRIGAATTLATLAEHRELSDVLPIISQTAMQMGAVQIRNRATIGGNIASAMPAGDLLPVLKCLDCQIVILQRNNTIVVKPFDDVVKSAGKTCLGNGDLITAIKIPLKVGETRLSAFGKIGRRQELTIARLNLAMLADYHAETNRIQDVHIVAGAIAPVPLRLKEIERELKGRVIDQMFADDFLDLLIKAVDEAIPGRHSQKYKRHAVIGLGLDVMRNLFNREFEYFGPAKEHP